MRLPRLLIALLLLVAACAPTAATTTTRPELATAPTATAPTTSTTTTTAPAATTTPAPDTTVPATTTTMGPIAVPSLSDAHLELMLPEPETLGADYQGFQVIEDGFEANAVLVNRTLQNPADEAQDVEEYGRTGGARLALRPRLLQLSKAGIQELHVWVSLFVTPQGASSYLADFAQDAAKGDGAAAPSDLLVDAAATFPVEGLGEEALGLVLTEREGGNGGHTRFQTVVAHRLGRLLLFVSVITPEDTDQRVRALGLAATLSERALDVITGRIAPPPPPPRPQALEAYAFSYEQLIDKGRTEGTIASEGVHIVADGALSCQISLELGGSKAEREYVVIGDTAWTNVPKNGAPRWERGSPDAFNTKADLVYCPGWQPELELSGLELLLAGAPPANIEVEGSPSLRYQLGREGVVALGLLSEDADIEVEDFTVVIDAVSPWVRSLRIEMRGPTSAFVDTFGDEFGDLAGANSSIVIEFATSQINDPALSVEPPT